PQSIGLAAGDWCSFGGGDDTPTDQRDDDGGSLTFDSAPLGERLEILGAPVADLELAVDRPQAALAVRLNEIRPDGSSVRVTYGVLNLTHRTSHEHPEALEPGRRYRVRVALNHIAHAFAAGSRLRLAVSTAYWPVVWPSAQAVALTLFTGASGLELPVRPPDPGDDRLRPFEAPEGAPPASYVELRPRRVERTVEREGAAGEIVYGVLSEGGQGRMEEIDLELEQSSVRRYRIQEHDPLTARAEVVQRMGLRRGPWAVAVESRVWLSATEEAFAQPLSLHLLAFSLCWGRSRPGSDDASPAVDHRRAAEGRAASASRCPSRSSLQKRARAAAHRLSSVCCSPLPSRRHNHRQQRAAARRRRFCILVDLMQVNR